LLLTPKRNETLSALSVWKYPSGFNSNNSAADKKPQSALIVSHQIFFEQLAMINLQIVQEQKHFAPRIFYQPIQKFDYQTCDYFIPGFRKSLLSSLITVEIESRIFLRSQIRRTGSAIGNANSSKKGA